MFAFTLSGIIKLLLSIILITSLGYGLGRITIKGVSLGTAGVFIVALLFGALFPTFLSDALTIKTTAVSDTDPKVEMAITEFREILSTEDFEVFEVELDKANKEKKDPVSVVAAEAERILKDESFDKKLDKETKELFKSLNKTLNYSSNALKIIENMGLILFVTSVGFIAGPNFFANFKKNFKSYILLGFVIILAGGLSAIGCYYVGLVVEPDINPDGLMAMIVGLLSGSLTSTPAFSAAKETVAAEFEGLVTVGHGIAYLFGVIGVVLFVQLIPKITKANMAQERALLTVSGEVKGKTDRRKYIELDEFGIAAFGLAAALGVLLGGIKIAKFFSLGTTGGTLIVSLVIGYLAHIGPISMKPKEATLKIFREFGLTLFLVGAGIAGGIEFMAEFKAIYFVYGVIMTIIPMVIGFLFAKYVLKLSLLNNLGSITGGMTSTPALGTLIHVAGTEDVASAYAATYPIALIAVVLVSQFLILLF